MGLFTKTRKAPAPSPAPRPVAVVGVALPPWATLHEGDSPRPIVDVDAHAMYKAWLAELRTYYHDHTPNEFLDGEGRIKPEWIECLIDLDADPTTCYWLEVCYQCHKMELQIAMKTFAFEIHVHDYGKKYAQRDHASGRGAQRAAGGMQGGREAREHFKRLRGFIPS